MPAYHLSTTVKMPFDQAVDAVMAALQRHGFGVLSDIDVRGTLQKKLGVDFRRYRILGACNPQMAYRALQAEDHIGTMLPCNVVVQERDAGTVEVSAVDPVASMQAIDNRELGATAAEVRDMLQRVVDDITAGKA